MSSITKKNKENKYLTVNQAASFLNVNVNTIRRWAQNNIINGAKIGLRGDWRFTKRELIKMIHTKKNDKRNLSSIIPFLRKDNLEQKDTIKALKKTEKALKESELHYRNLFENMLNGFAYCEMLYDKKEKPIDFIYLDIKDSFSRLTGLNNVIGKKVTEVIPGIKESNPELFEIYGRVALHGKAETFETQIQPLGIWFSISVYSPKKKHFVAVFDNITERKKIEETLRNSEERYKTLTEASPDCIKLFDKNGNLLYINKAGLKEHGLNSIEEAKSWDYLGSVIEDDRKKFREVLQRAIKGEENTIEIRHTVNGSIREICLETMAPVFNKKGKVDFVYGVSRDITEQKKLEQQKDEFLAITSHELKTPVTSIKAYGQILQRVLKQKKDKNSVTILSKLDIQINKLTMLVNDLLDITIIQTGKLKIRQEYFDFNTLIEEITENIEHFSDNHKITKYLSQTRQIYGDRNRIGQVMINLTINAIKYSPHADLIIIKTKANNNEIIFSVTDFGIGIPENKKDKIFDKFYRVTEYSGNIGLGLGLYISNVIIKRHNGSIWVDSIPGKGSTFFIRLPVQKQESDKQRIAATL